MLRVRWTAPERTIIAALALLVVACASTPAPPPGADPVALLYAPHHRDGAFFNPWKQFRINVPASLLWFLRRNPWAEEKVREPVIPIVPNDGSALSAASVDEASITWVGHATVAVRDGDDVFLTDPHWGEGTFVLPRETSPGLPIEAVPPDAFAVLSHNHYDHLDESTVERLPATIEWYVPLGLAGWFRARGRERVVELDWWQSVRRGRWTIHCLPSQHWSRRLWSPMNQTLWCSWLLDSGERRYLFAGDTGYFAGFAEFGRRFEAIDVALLPIAPFEPYEAYHDTHMSPRDALRAFVDLRAAHLVPIHWGAFDFSWEPLDLPPRELRDRAREELADPDRVRVLAIGETWRIPSDSPGERSPVPAGVTDLPGDLHTHAEQ